MNLTSKRESLRRFYSPSAKLFFNLGIHPNLITLLSLLFGLLSAWFFYSQRPLLGSFCLFMCGIFDLSDGEVARLSCKTSGFGAVFDWSVDKTVDIFVLGGIGLAYSSAFVTLSTIAISTLHSFLKPLAHLEVSPELKDKLESVGFFGRPETHIFIILFGALEGLGLSIGLSEGYFLILLLSFLSFSERFFYLYKHS